MTSYFASDTERYVQQREIMDSFLCRVLLVDDNEDDQLIVRDLLADITTTEYDLHWVDSYGAARVALLQHRYDVCLLDYRLGESNGVDLLREFSGGAVPFILLTGEESFEVDVAAAKAGSADYLIKGHINSSLLERSIRYATERKKTEVALQQAQIFAQATVDALPSSIAVLDESGTIVTVNAAWEELERINGFTAPASGIGVNYLASCEEGGSSDGLTAAAGIRAIISGQRDDFAMEYPCHSLREQCWYKMGATRFSGHGPLRVVVAHENITKRKLAEMALRSSELRFQSIVANVPGMVFQCESRVDGEVHWSFISEGCRDLFETEPEVVQGQSHWLRNVIHPDDLDSFLSSTALANEHATPWRWEGRHRLVSGKTKWIQGGARLARTPEGGVLWNGLIMDITALKEAEEQRDRFFTMSIDLLGVAGFDGYYKRLNPAFFETLGFSEAELLARPFVEFIHDEDQALTLEAAEKLRKGDAVIGFENRHRSKDGSWRWLEWKSVSVPQDGLIYAAARDVTMRKEAEASLHRLRDELEARVLERTAELAAANQSLQVENIQHQLTMGTLQELADAYRQAKEEADSANRAKSEFLSRMSHELRTPLNAVLGFGQILDSQELPESARESVGYILQGGQHLLDLINEVLDIASVEAGRMELAPEPTALVEVFPELCALLRPLAAQRGIRIIQNVEALEGQFVLADQQRLKQVLINLLSNAIKYNREHGQIEIRSHSREDGWTSIAVTDTGLGISPANIAKLFTPFERLNAGNTAIEGTGLGLTLSRRLVEAMGGTLNVKSVVDQGTTFIVELPSAYLAEPEAAESAVAEAELEIERRAEHDCSVLCIEDNLSNLKLMEAIFGRRSNISMLSATRGPLGLELARRYRPDLILLDLDLPGMQAPEILIRLLQSPVTREIPVVIVSADATPSQIERLLHAGAKDYLTKPINIANFLRTVDRFLRDKTPEGA